MSDEELASLAQTVHDSSQSKETDVVKNLYHKSCSGNCPSRWSEFSISKEERDAVEAKAAQAPIVNRLRLDHKGGDWKPSEFTVNSQPMRDILGKALENYPDLDLDVNKWTFVTPFEPIVHRWGRLKALGETAPESPDKGSVDDLITFLTPILEPHVKSLTEINDTGMVDFNSVWQIFPPGELVVRTHFGEQATGRVVGHKLLVYRGYGGGDPRWQITVEYVDWNGEQCGFGTEKIHISFSGIRHVTDLPVYPLAFANGREEVRERLIRRGRMFEQLRGYCFREYDGVEVLNKGATRKLVSGRVIIDAYAYYSSHDEIAPELKPLSDDRDGYKSSSASESSEEIEPVDKIGWDMESSPTGTPPSEAADLTVMPKARSRSRSEDFTPLSEEQCLLAAPWVIGMDLKRKEWGLFCVDRLEEIVWNNKAFDNLVLPGGEKELAWEFVESKTLANNTSDDFIPGKDRGLIVLMFGPPGVGKTYTAEAVAERSHVPLYSISAGALGTDPAEAEESLERALELCRMWDAMLLLDEADVFLGARTNEGLDRNELVSIFLTKLEYYQGILFLTTNRSAHIDHAFQSRVDLLLPYRNLTTEVRRKIWVNFVEHIGRDKFDIENGDLDRLAGLCLNGREIKNLIKSAQLLSRTSGGVVTAERLYQLARNRVEALKMLADQAY